jgi:NADPH2:quinone reductase
LHTTGGPDELGVDEIGDPKPGSGQVAVSVAAAGLNYIDTYHRTGAYPLELPTVIGLEGAGTVVAVGEGVTALRQGDRVAWASVLGSYAEVVVADEDSVVRVPDGMELETAAALMLQGMTAHYLAMSTFPLREGHVALVHAGAGGVGQLLIQIAKRQGARVLTTVSTQEKAELAKEAGADETICYTDVDVVEAVKTATGGEGVHVVYDSVGQTTFDNSLDVLRPRGMLVLYGQSSGPVPPVDPQRLAAGGSLFLTRPSLGAYTSTPEELNERAGDVFAMVGAGELGVRIDRTFALDETAEAHSYIEGRQTKGKVLLLP